MLVTFRPECCGTLIILDFKIIIKRKLMCANIL